MPGNPVSASTTAAQSATITRWSQSFDRRHAIGALLPGFGQGSHGGGGRAFGPLGGALEHLGPRGPGDFLVEQVEQERIQGLPALGRSRLQTATDLVRDISDLQQEPMHAQ